MKLTGRNIKRRLYGLRNLPSNLKRTRYWRGHGVHSPYIYSIVRQVFMAKTLKTEQTDLYQALLAYGVAKKRAIELQNLMVHCQYTSFAIDCDVEHMQGKDFVLATLAVDNATLKDMATKATSLGSTLCIISPSFDQERDSTCHSIVESHLCTSVDNRGYLLLFNNHLPKQKFRL